MLLPYKYALLSPGNSIVVRNSFASQKSDCKFYYKSIEKDNKNERRSDICTAVCSEYYSNLRATGERRQMAPAVTARGNNIQSQPRAQTLISTVFIRTRSF